MLSVVCWYCSSAQRLGADAKSTSLSAKNVAHCNANCVLPESVYPSERNSPNNPLVAISCGRDKLQSLSAHVAVLVRKITTRNATITRVRFLLYHSLCLSTTTRCASNATIESNTHTAITGRPFCTLRVMNNTTGTADTQQTLAHASVATLTSSSHACQSPTTRRQDNSLDAFASSTR